MARRDAVGVTGRTALALFAVPGPDATAADVVAALRELSPDGWIGERIGGELPKRDPDTVRPLPLLPCPFTAVLLTHIEPTRHPACPERSRGTLDAAQRVWISLDTNGLCSAASVLMLGTEHIVQPGEGAILVTMLTRRRTEFNQTAYFRRWRNEHAPFGLRIGAAGYRQLHAHGDTSGFDGAGMVFFDDLDHARRVRAAPEVAEDATRDEMRFIDHSASMLAMFRRV
jgi:hypothetical protein